MDDSGEKSRMAPERTYAAELRCPACGTRSSQLLLRARQIVTMTVPGKPFHRAFCWTHGRPTLKDSPLYHGVLLCPECRYPGLEWDFQPHSDLPPPNTRSLHKLFADERAGRQGDVNDILTVDPSLLPQPERTLRLLFASLRAEMLSYPELWRKEILGQICQRVAWIYLDLLHLNWSQGDLTGPPSYNDQGPNAEALKQTLRALEPLKERFPEIPFEESRAFAEALKWFEQLYQTRSQEPGAEEMAREELRLARLHGLLGKKDTARDLYDRARETAYLGRDEALLKRDNAWNKNGGEVAEWRELGIKARRLVLLMEEIYSERVSIFGSPMDNPSSRQKARRFA